MEVPGNAQQDAGNNQQEAGSNKVDHRLKIITIGESNVGKTCLIFKYCDNVFQSQTVNTLGVEMRTKKMKVDDKKVQLKIFDTAGQEKFKSITQNYYNKV